MPAPLPPRIRIEANVEIDPATGCWVWSGARGADGYGRIGVHYKKKLAHRVAYEDFVGPIPPGLQIDHLCFNRCCANPAHLEAVTGAENVARAGAAGLLDRKSTNTHCKNGHAFTAENTNRTPQGWRECRACGREKMRRLRSRARLSNGDPYLTVRT